jgi:hypothetical protein
MEDTKSTTTVPKTESDHWRWEEKITFSAENHEAAKRTAIIYSLLGTCKINNVNPTE